MSKSTVLVLGFVLSSIIGQSSCSLIRAVKRIAKEPSENQNVQTSQSSKNPKPNKGEKIRSDRPFAEFQREILEDLKSENFDAIDRKADAARRDKARFTGGYWKLKILYGPLTEIFVDGIVTQEMWTGHLAKLEKWKQKSPQSITARVALGQAKISYAWFARGAGYSNTVTDKDADTADKRLKMAFDELMGAQKLADKCPQWYESMLFLAMAQSWNAEDYDRLFAEALNFEPDYYYYYYDKATNSLPRWGGSKGDWEKFAVELEDLDSKEKDIIYFFYVSNMIVNYYDDWTDQQNISWERAKRGYKQLEANYGTDKQRLNQYALLASVNEDMPEAYNAFTKIGEDWDDEIFSAARFNEIKTWAIARYKAENGI
jgi:Domain of unknown function (DUF4034)